MVNLSTYYWGVERVVHPTTDSIHIEFDTGSNSFEYEPGQFVNIIIPIAGVDYIRSYSLSSFSDVHKNPSITVKRVKNGFVSNFLCENVKVGDKIQVEGPFGNFVPNTFAKQADKIVLISGGSGITPLWSIIHFYLYKTNAALILLYGNKNVSDIIFFSELNVLTQTFNNRLKIFHALSHEKTMPPEISDGINDRLSKLIIKKKVKQLLAEHIYSAAYFICGPQGLIENAEECLDTIGVSPEQIQKEHFIIPAESEKLQYSNNEIREVLLMYEEQIHLLEVQPGDTILDAALKDYVSIKYSCKNGTCGTCWAINTSGKVVMKRNYALTEEKINQGYVLLCQSIPVTEDVTVEINSFI